MMGGKHDDFSIRRCHIAAETLAIMVRDVAQAEGLGGSHVDFVVRLPDSRMEVSLAVLFCPEDDAFVAAEPSDTLWDDIFVPAAGNLTSLALMGRQTAAEQGGRMLFADPVFGRLSAPAPLPGDTFGWLVSDRPDAPEWFGRLTIGMEGAVADYPGKWVAKAVYTDATGGMHPDEWARVVEKLRIERLGRLRNLAWRGGG
jgi:hypothetical protein